MTFHVSSAQLSESHSTKKTTRVQLQNEIAYIFVFGNCEHFIIGIGVNAALKKERKRAFKVLCVEAIRRRVNIFIWNIETNFLFFLIAIQSPMSTNMLTSNQFSDLSYLILFDAAMGCGCEISQHHVAPNNELIKQVIPSDSSSVTNQRPFQTDSFVKIQS